MYAIRSARNSIETGEGRVTEVGLFYEDFVEGARFTTGARVVTQADVEAFAEVSGDRNPLHLDEVYAAGSVFGRRVAHGALGLAIATGLVNERGLTRGTLVAFLGLTWDFVAPLVPGAEVTVALEVVSRRESSRGHRGVVVLGVELRSGEDVLQRGEWKLLVARRP